MPARGALVGAAAASMEPQLEGCGKTGGAASMTSKQKASMEPQLEGCGKYAPWGGPGMQTEGFNGAAT